MKMNFTSPIWIQSASNVGETPETRFVFTEGINKVNLTANGLVVIESVQGGEVVRETYSELNNTYVTINADEGTEIIIYGEVTIINNSGYPNVFTSLDLKKNAALTYLDCNGCSDLTSLDLSKNAELTHLYCYGCTSLTSLDLKKNAALTYLDCNECRGLTNLDLSNNIALTYLGCGDCTGLTSLDLSKNAALTSLDCYSCTGLTSLDLSKNAALTSLNCYDCLNLLMLNIKNTAALSEGIFIDQSMVTLTTLQVAGTSTWAYWEVESWLSDHAPDNGTIYADGNTPQGVIAEAEGKSWTVEYV